MASEAIQAVAAAFARRIDDKFEAQLASELTAARMASWRAELSSKPLYTQQDYAVFLGPFVTQFLPSFYHADDQAVQEIASRAAETISQTSDVPHDLVPGLAKLALYDFVILCGM